MRIGSTHHSTIFTFVFDHLLDGLTRNICHVTERREHNEPSQDRRGAIDRTRQQRISSIEVVQGASVATRYL